MPRAEIQFNSSWWKRVGDAISRVVTSGGCVHALSTKATMYILVVGYLDLHLCYEEQRVAQVRQ